MRHTAIIIFVSAAVICLSGCRLTMNSNNTAMVLSKNDAGSEGTGNNTVSAAPAAPNGSAAPSEISPVSSGSTSAADNSVYLLDSIHDNKMLETGGAPYGIAFGSKGCMYVAKDRGEIVKITPDGTVSPFFKTDETNSTPGLTQIWDLCPGPNGNIYVPAGDRLFRITPDGKATTLIHDPEVFPVGITFDPNGNFYVTSGLKVFKYTPELQKSVFIDCGKSVKDMIFSDLIFDNGFKNLYVANYAWQQISRFAVNEDGTAGKQSIIFDAGKLQKSLGNLRPEWYNDTRSAHPAWFTRDNTGNIFVSLENICIIMKIGKDSTFTMYDIDKRFFNSTIAFGGAGFDENSIYTTGYRDGCIHRLSFTQGEN